MAFTMRSTIRPGPLQLRSWMASDTKTMSMLEHGARLMSFIREGPLIRTGVNAAAEVQNTQ